MSLDSSNAILLWTSYLGLPAFLTACLAAVLRSSYGAQPCVLALLAVLVVWFVRKAQRSLSEDASAVTAAPSDTEPAVGSDVVMSFRRTRFRWTAQHVPKAVIRSWQLRGDKADEFFRLGMGVEEFREAAAPISDLPDWVDYELLDEGCRFFVRVWPFVFFGFSWALLGGFGAESASAVLLKSRYWAARGVEGRQDTWLRLRETACWLYDCAAHGAAGFVPGGVAWKACLQVRYLHCRTRASIKAAGSWEKEREKYGEPLNQGQVVGTLLGSSVLLLQGMEELAGLPLPQRQKEAFVHLWRVIGFLFGIDDDINPNRNYHDGNVIMESVFSEGIPEKPDPELTQVLTQHICESVAHGARTEFGVPMSAGMVAAAAWLFLGRTYGRAIGLPDSSAKALFFGFCRVALLRLVMWPLLLLPGASMVYERIMGRGFTKMVESIRSRQPHCRFGVTCPVSGGRLGSACPFKGAAKAA
eukprot:TRINITY_DN25616_c0_g1_i1.p2 TRINITY_DN25616_c0_g1~~TRINITY_DN25616_c0_g1_i1.p2  ORF type:complete len:472 (-),score=105.88 TRINITY_DN25616_c0_g1_i1:205-1620(-)